MLEIMIPMVITGILLVLASGLGKHLGRKDTRRAASPRRRTQEAIERRIAARRPTPRKEPKVQETLPSIPSALEYRRRAYDARVAKALREEEERERREAARKAGLQALLERRLDRAELLRVQHAIEHAVDEGAIQVEIARFPVELTTDRGRAVNNYDLDWDTTLRGLPADLYAYFVRLPGYGFRAYVCQFREDGTPETIALVLYWG